MEDALNPLPIIPLNVLLIPRHLQIQQLAMGCAGFMMYKVAVVGVLTVPALFQWWGTTPSEN